MSPRHFFLPTLLICSGLALPLRAADPAPSAESRLRDTLRSTMAQLQTAESDRVAAQAAKADLEQKNKDLAEQLKAVLKQEEADKAAADKTHAALKAQLVVEFAEVAKLKEALAESQAAHARAEAALHAAGETGAKLTLDIRAAQSRADDLFRKNQNLYKLGLEILQRYEKFSLGEALAAKEPFVGSRRARLETEAQDYSDKLREQKSTP
ncbi:MAG: phage major capsid protein [Verrucomicrobia bacterium]|nr:phage major capsid protein [Verrucomicrobiota bacterium]